MVSLLAVVFSDLVIVVSWKANQAYIARTMCVERDLAESDCGGTCYLTAQLKAQQQASSEDVPLATLLEQSRSVLAMLPEVISTLHSPFRPLSTPMTYHDRLPETQLISDIFHPPRI